MVKIDWKAKLSSRKLWVAVIAILATVLTALFRENIPEGAVGLIEKGVIALCCYIFGEAGVDIARAIWNGAASKPTDAGTPIVVEETIPPGEIDVEAVGIHNKVPDGEVEDESDQAITNI